MRRRCISSDRPYIPFFELLFLGAIHIRASVRTLVPLCVCDFELDRDKRQALGMAPCGETTMSTAVPPMSQLGYLQAPRLEGQL